MRAWDIFVEIGEIKRRYRKTTGWKLKEKSNPKIALLGVFFWKGYYAVQYGRTSKRKYYSQITCKLNFSSSSRSSKLTHFLNVAPWSNMDIKLNRSSTAFLCVQPEKQGDRSRTVMQLSFPRNTAIPPVTIAFWIRKFYFANRLLCSSHLHTLLDPSPAVTL